MRVDGWLPVFMIHRGSAEAFQRRVIKEETEGTVLKIGLDF